MLYDLFQYKINRKLLSLINILTLTTYYSCSQIPIFHKEFKHEDLSVYFLGKANTQNFTLGVSFGATREVAFQYAGERKDKTSPVISFDLKDNEVYAFTKNVNLFWKHGIRQNVSNNEGRISIIIWGWKDI